MCNVLLVDDDETLSKIYKKILESCGHSVALANNGKDGLDRLSELKYKLQIILLDIQMPIMDGFEFLKTIRSRHIDIPVVIISGVEHSRIENLDVYGILQKPISKEVLLSKVEECVNSYSSLAEELVKTLEFLRSVNGNGRKRLLQL
jgi:CheY-like chemotaxis protein